MADNAVTFEIRLDAKLEGASRLSSALKGAEEQIHGVDAALKHVEGAAHSAGAKTAAFGHQSEEAHRKGGHAAKEHGSEWEGLGGAIEHAYGHLHQFLYFTGAIAAYEVVERLIDGVKDLGEEILHAAAAEERIGKSFEFNFGVEGGEEALKYAEKLGRAMNTEFTDDQAKGYLNRLRQAGVGLKDLDGYMSAAMDVAARSTDPVEGMANAIEALSRATLRGSLDGRSLLRLNIGPDQLRELDEYKGKSDKYMKAIISDGSVTIDQLLRAIAGADGVLGDQAAKMAGTMSSQLRHLGALKEQYFQGLDKSEGYAKLKTKFADILTAFDPEGPEGERIFSSLERAFDSIAGVVGGIDFKHVAHEVSDVILPDIARLAADAAKIDWMHGVDLMVKGLEAALQIVQGISYTYDKIADAVASLTGNSDADLKRKKNQAIAEENVPRDLRQAALAEAGDLGETPASADAARAQYETIRSQRENRNAIRRHVPFVHLEDEKVSAVELYMQRLAQEMENVERSGPQEVRGRAGFRGGSGMSELPEGYTKNASYVADALVSSPETDALLASEQRHQEKFFTTGAAKAQGLIDGYLSKLPEAEKAAATLPEAMHESAKRKAEVQSPSRLFRRLGRHIGDGFTEGVYDHEGAATDAGEDLVAAMADGARGDVAGDPIGFSVTTAEPPGVPVAQAPGMTTPRGAVPPVAAGQRPIEISINFNLGAMPSGAGREQADELLDRLRASAPAVIQGIVEQMAIEAGV